MARILVLGASGVFGRQIAKELLGLGHSLTLVARNLDSLQAFAAGWTGDFAIQALDVSDRKACESALRGHAIAVHAAGPFSQRGMEVAQACLEQGCHYVDIADDRDYLQKLRGLNLKFSERGLTAVYGCSSLPGISGALTQVLAKESRQAPRVIEVLLFIGNRNPKGQAAMASVFNILGERIEAPQGTLIGMREAGWDVLPAPFGKKLALNFESPEYDLFPRQFGCEAVEVKIAFESNLANRLFARLSRVSERWRSFLMRLLMRLANAGSGVGSSGGAIRVRFHFPDGTSSVKEIVVREQGQRLAILPVSYAVQKLGSGGGPYGVQTAYEFLGGEALLQALLASGIPLLDSAASPA